MMDAQFDQAVQRRGTMSLKYDCASSMGMPEGLIPLWVADMDFLSPPAVREKLAEAAAFGIYGYTESGKEYDDAVAGWLYRRHRWEIQPSWLVQTPGVVFALAMAVRAFTQRGDAVLIQRPVYYPFTSVIEKNGRRVVNNPLVLTEGHYEIDFADFEKKISEHQVKLFILCNPHNPVGRVFREWELRRMADICLEHGVLMVSDEIHSDFIWGKNRHIPLASLDEKYQSVVITATAPSKTFNLAGLQMSNILIPDPALKKRFEEEIAAVGMGTSSLMGIVACMAAYQHGDEWLEALKSYLQGNIAWMKAYVERYLPKVHMIEPEGTYLVWLDFRDLGLDEDSLEKLIVDKAGLWLDRGAIFGKEGEGFERVNIACPRSVLEQAMGQLRQALDDL